MVDIAQEDRNGERVGMNSYAELSEEMTTLLHLEQPPVAISFSNSVPEGIAAHGGHAPAGCRFWQDAVRAPFFTSVSDHEMCSIGVYTHNLEPSPAQQVDLMDALKVFAELGYVRQEDFALIPVLGHRFKYVVYSPLANSPLLPDIVLLFVSANQTLILTEATQQVENQNAPAMGRPACAVVPQVINTGRAALSLGCCGARAYLDNFTDNVAIFAIPGAKLEAYVDRIRVLASANSMLAKFHRLRRDSVASGQRPSVQDSLEAFAASQR
jgi:uncharacterized protein (DUF169 family)